MCLPICNVMGFLGLPSFDDLDSTIVWCHANGSPAQIRDVWYHANGKPAQIRGMWYHANGRPAQISR